MAYSHQNYSQQQPWGQQRNQYGQQYPGQRQSPGASDVPPPNVRPDIWQWFKAVDADRSGSISCMELQRALLNGNWSPFNEETCRMMIGMFDADHSGTIDVHEFGRLWDYIQQWKYCFESYDTDRSGNIDANELHTALSSFGYRLSKDFCDLVVKKFDREGRNKSINFDDFIQSCVMLKSLTDAFRSKDTNQTGTIWLHYEQFLEMVIDNTLT
ncbi:Pef1 (predicted) [Pycnogonum litorale]